MTHEQIAGAQRGRLSAAEREVMLEELRALRADVDGLSPEEMRQHFVWRAEYRELLDDRYWLVRGGRGSGKSSLCKFLAAQLRDPDDAVQLSSELRYMQSVEIWVEHDDAYRRGMLDALTKIEERETARWAFWMGMLVDRLARRFRGHEGLPPLPAFMAHAQEQAAERDRLTSVSLWLPAAVKTPRPLEYWLDDFGDWWGVNRGRLILLYDNIDLFWDDNATNPSALIEALLSLWMSRPEHRHGRVIPKLFLRDDTFARTKARMIDAPKLEARSRSLQWSSESLYRVLIHQIAQGHRMGEWLSERHFAKRFGEHNRVVDRLPEGDPTMETALLLREVNQASFGEWMIGRWMGEGATRGYVARWIYNRICDFNGVATPRTLINLFKGAAKKQREEQVSDEFAPLLSYEAVKAGFRAAADARVEELEVELTLAKALMEPVPLRLLVDREELLRRLVGHKDGQPFERAQAELKYRELERLGIFKEIKPGFVDMPELYRYGYGLKRGGVSKTRG